MHITAVAQQARARIARLWRGMPARFRARNAIAREQIRALWSDMKPDLVEVLTAFISLSFGAILAFRGRDSNALGAGATFYALLCFTAAACKLVGWAYRLAVLRIAGLLLGVIFWVTVSTAFLLTIPGSISWLCFAVMAVAQLWAVRQVVRQRR